MTVKKAPAKKAAAKKAPAKKAAAKKAPAKRAPAKRAAAATAVPAEVPRAGTELLDLPLSSLAPHPHNVREDLGDLGDLADSIRAQGVLEPFLVLPKNLLGEYLVVAGHRRLAAALSTASPEMTVPCVVRDLDERQVLEAMLVENLQRSELTPIEEARAYARLIDLDSTVAHIATRVGRTPAHVKGRLALLSLPDPLLDRVATGGLTLADAAALGSHADDDDAMEWLEKLPSAERNPVAALDSYLTRRDAQRRYDETVDEIRQAGGRIWAPSADTGYFYLPSAQIGAGRPAVMVSKLGLDGDHSTEACHAFRVEQEDYGQRKITVHEVCTDSMRHTPLGDEETRSEMQCHPARYEHLLGQTDSDAPRPPSVHEVRRAALAAQKAATRELIAIETVELTGPAADAVTVLLAGMAEVFDGSLDDISALLGWELEEAHEPEHFLALATADPGAALLATGHALARLYGGFSAAGTASIQWLMARGYKPGSEGEAALIAESGWDAEPRYTVDDAGGLLIDGKPAGDDEAEDPDEIEAGSSAEAALAAMESDDE